MATIDLGRLGFVNKGTYNNSTTYEKNDLVQFTDSGILSTYLYIDSTAQSGQAPSSSGTVGSRWVYFAKGVADAVASAGNNKVLVTDGSGGLSPLSIGSAGQALKVNSGATGLEFGSISSSTFAQAIASTTGSTNFGGSTNDSTERYNGLTVDITPTSASNKILIMFGQQQRFHQGGGGSGDGGGFHNYLKRGNSSTTIGSVGDAVSGFGGTQSSLWYQTYCFWNNSTSQIETCYMTYSYLDSPNTTSLCRYFTSVKNTGGTENLRWMVDAGTTYLYAIEIKS